MFPIVFGLKLLSPCAVEQSEETLKKRNAEKSLSIMDYYQHDVFSHLETDARTISQYSLLHKESSLDGKAGDRLSVSIWTAHYSGLIGFLSLKAPLQACFDTHQPLSCPLPSLLKSLYLQFQLFY